nr:hypothetical protein [Bradyrhizobium sp. 33ap4]
MRGVKDLRVVDASVMPTNIGRQHKCTDDYDCGEGRRSNSLSEAPSDQCLSHFSCSDTEHSPQSAVKSHPSH